jgi:hypothetical protein
MKKHLLGSLIVGALGATAISAPAAASMVTETYAFTLSNFVDVVGNAPSPLTSISGSFTITFDPSAFADDQTMGLVVNYLTDTHIASAIGSTIISPSAASRTTPTTSRPAPMIFP